MCCGRVPVFGLWGPEAAALDTQNWLEDRNNPTARYTIDWLCPSELRCVGLRDARYEAVPLNWGLLDGELRVLVSITGFAVLAGGGVHAIEGDVLAIYVDSPGGWKLKYVTSSTVFALEDDKEFTPSPPREGGGDGWD